MFAALKTTSKIFALLADLVLSGEANEAQKSDSIGFSVGPTYGIGASYKKSLFGGKFGAQITACPPLYMGGNNFFGGGGTVFYNFGDISSWARPYVSFGAAAYRRTSDDWHQLCDGDDDYNIDEALEQQKQEAQYRPALPPGVAPEPLPERPCYSTQKEKVEYGIGIGPALGIEMRFNKLLTFNLELPCALSWTHAGFQIFPIPNFSIRANI